MTSYNSRACFKSAHLLFFATQCSNQFAKQFLPIFGSKSAPFQRAAPAALLTHHVHHPHHAPRSRPGLATTQLLATGTASLVFQACSHAQRYNYVPGSICPSFYRRRKIIMTNRELLILQDPVQLYNLSSLPNGVRVATESLPGPFAGVGVYIDAGSRYEDQSLRGVSHIIDRLAFKSTTSRSVMDMFEQLEALGGNIQCASSRESLMYQSASFNSAVPTTLGLLAETIRDPLIKDEEVAEQLEIADYEITELWGRPEIILSEVVNIAAYKDNTLGNPLLCPRDRLDQINRSTILKYRNTFFQPERMVVAFAGVSHEEAVRLTEKMFGDMKSTANYGTPPRSDGLYDTSVGNDPSSGILGKIPFLKNKSTSITSTTPTLTHADLTRPSHYTGGFLALSPIPIPPSPALPRLSHIHIAFEAPPISSPDIYALATLQTLLGGGGSFSAGGPGKGMYSRLYTNVLNQHIWVESCMAFNLSYADSSLFGIAASCTPTRIVPMLDVMCRELYALTQDYGRGALESGEVERAKNQLRSSLLMNLESRMVELEDLGRQVQVHGRKIGVQEMCRAIDALTIGDLRRVARKVFNGLVENEGKGSGQPTVVIQEGEAEGVRLRPLQYGEIQQRIARWRLSRT